MIYHLSLFFKQYFSGLNFIHYISFRAMAGLISAFLFSVIGGGWFIHISQNVFRSKARAWTPDNHRQKDGMPTMGGLFILTAVLLNIFLWCKLTQSFVWIFMVCLILFGVIGFLDDLQKIKKQRGITAKQKIILQISSACFIAFLLIISGIKTTVTIPFLKNINPDLGWLFVPWVVLVIVGTSNAVNLTDGLDGLAINSLISNFSLFSFVCYLAGNFALATYLHIPFVQSAEITVIGSILIGASLGFLWYNAYPAQIFMGDVGSLALGSGVALMAIMSKQVLLLPIAGGLFVLEAVSVILQVFSIKLRGKRMFKMAPIHHHFELKKWPENRITVRFGIITLMLCLVALITLKIR